MRRGDNKLNGSRQENNWDRTELQRLRVAFPNDAQLVDLLQRKPGFEKINRSTVHRWCKVSRNPLPRRARAAIQILRSEVTRFSSNLASLRIAHHTTALATSAFLTYALRTGEAHGGATSLLENYNTRGTRIQTNTGKESLDRLADKDADIGLAHVGLLGEYHKSRGCSQLCLVSIADTSAVASVRVTSIEGLRGKKIGVPANSFMGNKVIDTLKRLGLSSDDARSQVQECQDPSEAAQRFPKAIQCIVAWDEWVDLARTRIKNESPTSVNCFNVPGSLFPLTEFAAYVNLSCADPTAVRAFLLALKDVTRDFDSSLKAVPDDSFDDVLGMNRAKVELYKRERHASFVLAELDADAILDLWRVGAAPGSSVT